MMWTGAWRRVVIGVACVGAGMAAPASATALSTHSATASTPNSAGQLVATAKCGAHQHVVSGGFKTPHPYDAFGTVVSRAVKGGWNVTLFPKSTTMLTAYAYCAHNGQLSLSKDENQVTAAERKGNTVSTASCSGETVISGGWAYSPSTGERNSPTYRDYADGAGKWTVMSVFRSTPAKLTAFAYCGRGVVVNVRSSTSGRIFLGGSATASCHKGETLLSGGYTTTPTPDWHNTRGPDFFYSGSYRSGVRSWTARAGNYGMPGKITVFAYCEA